MNRRVTGRVTIESFVSCIVFLALFFLLGIVLGQVLAHRMPNTISEELVGYLRDYLPFDSKDHFTARTVFSAIVIYFRYPLLAFLSGFTSIGFVLLPCVTTSFGFFLSFSINCFADAFGGKGILLALIVLGVRCLVTLPCYFLLAIPAWAASDRLAALSLGKGRRGSQAGYRREDWLRFGLCVLVLGVSVGVELFLSPALLGLLLHRMFP